jgi:hypothetical protein
MVTKKKPAPTEGSSSIEAKSQKEVEAKTSTETEAGNPSQQAPNTSYN